ncbi:hypothetical protein ACHAPJ_006410 [Fusarium lateritium]
MIHGVNKTKFDSWVEEWRKKDFVSTHVSATGPADDAVYAGVMEPIDVPSWSQSCGTKDINNTFLDPKTQSDPPMVIEASNIGNEHTLLFPSPRNLTNVFNAKLAKHFWRPSKLFFSNDHIISPIFTDTGVGNWSAVTKHNKTELHDSIHAAKQNGMYPIDIQGGGSGSKEQFTAVFAELTAPKPRRWHARGEVVGFGDNAAAKMAMDKIMHDFMKKNGRGYTWAEDDRKVVTPDDKFLLGSVSKMFTHAAIQWLVDRDKLNFTDYVYPLLGYEPADRRAKSITIQHLLDHTAGYDRSMSDDIAFGFRKVARLGPTNGKKPATLRDIIEYMVRRPLDFTPGERRAYSNYGTMLLGYVVANVTNKLYLKFLEEEILEGEDVKLYETDTSKQKNGRIIQESIGIGLDPVNPLSDAHVPGAHGGDGAIKEESAAALSLAASASTLVKFVTRHAASGTGGRSESWREGDVQGARVHVESRRDFDWAVTLNTRDFVTRKDYRYLVDVTIPNFLDTYKAPNTIPRRE